MKAVTSQSTLNDTDYELLLLGLSMTTKSSNKESTNVPYPGLNMWLQLYTTVLPSGLKLALCTNFAYIARSLYIV